MTHSLIQELQKKEGKMTKIIVPPIKIQGKKAQLVEWLSTCITLRPDQRFVEPFIGSGVVGFNIAQKNALLRIAIHTLLIFIIN